LSGIQKELGPKGFAVIAGVLNEDANIPEFIQRFNPGFPVGDINRLGAYEYMQMKSDEHVLVPFMVFIDRKGIIRSQYTGTDKILDEAQSEKTLREEAEKFLNEGSRTGKAKPKPKPAVH
jgi:hypothetical protein